MIGLKEGLPPVPDRMKHLSIDPRGYPVPWFVGTVDGKPDFRVVKPGGLETALAKRVCWLCGIPLGRYLCFVVGPMCAVTRTTSEPPTHKECAEFAVKACPFLTNPNMVRSPRSLPEGSKEPAGVMIPRNPGVSCLWVTHNFRVMGAKRADGRPGILLQMGEPDHLDWWSHGRPATRAEVMASVESGCPALKNMAAAEGPEAVAEYNKVMARFQQLPDVVDLQ